MAKDLVDVEDIMQDETPEGRGASQIIKSILPDIYAEQNFKPSEFINKYWGLYQHDYKSNQNLNGKVFEALIALSLVREKIFPLYIQAKVTFIPGVNYDCIIYTEEFGPISLSAKTSLRERWKQADLEALALKNIHRKAKTYLITLEADEVRRRKADTSSVMALEDFILANTPEYDKLIEFIKSCTIIEAPTQTAVTSTTIITAENCIQHFS